jgi:Ca2+-binding RTX toxin-like protein
MKRIFLATAIALLALPALAHASTCQRIGTGLAVHMAGNVDNVELIRVGDQIYNGYTPCAGATVYNTSTIFISDATPNKDGDDYVRIDLSGGPFAPGTGSSSGGNVPEIGIQLYLAQGDNTVLVAGSNGADTIRGGQTIDHNGHYNQGLNLNAGAEEQPGKITDPDLVWQYWAVKNSPQNETFLVDGGGGGDTINLSGGPGFDLAVIADTTMSGGEGNDHLTGGDGHDMIYADPGDDVLNGGRNSDYVNFQTSHTGVNVDLANPNPQDNGALGKDQFEAIESVFGSEHDDVLSAWQGGGGLLGMGGNDVLTGSPSDDGINGGPGADTVSYARSPSGVAVDLGIGISQKTGAGWDNLANIENLTGGPHADELTGDGGPNAIDGGGGADSVAGKGGADELLVRDGTGDQATCGAGTDHVVADTQGTDAIFSDCESIDFAPFVPPTPPAPGPGSDPGTPAPGGDHIAPALTALKLKKKMISYKLSEPAAVKLRIQRKAGRKWKTTRRALSQKGLTGLNKKRLGKRLGRGSYRLIANATDAAANRSKTRVIRFRVIR